MRLSSLTNALAVCLLIKCTYVYADIDPAQLVKATSDNKSKCVEYYDYQGEMYCSTKALSTSKVDPSVKNFETQDIVFDQRAWQVAWGKKSDEVTTVEYVPMGDNIDDWHELITSQYFPGLQEQVTPKEFSKMIIQDIHYAGFSPHISYIKDTPNQVLFEFRIDLPENQIQDELQMITKGKDGLYVLHYVIKKTDMGEVERALWKTNLSNSSIKPR